MRDEKQITDEMRKILLDIELNKFDESKRTELKNRYNELKKEYSKTLLAKSGKTK